MLHTSGEIQGTAGLTRRPEPPKLPPVSFFRGRGYLLRSQLEQYKAEMLAFALGVNPPEPKIVDPDNFVPLKQVCAELGVGRRTIGRRIVEARVQAEPQPDAPIAA
jgi:hypothetical protein